MDNKSNHDPKGRLSIILVTSAIPMHPKVKKYLVPRFLIKSKQELYHLIPVLIQSHS